jgi:hypothetical protein
MFFPTSPSPPRGIIRNFLLLIYLPQNQEKALKIFCISADVLILAAASSCINYIINCQLDKNNSQNNVQVFLNS